MALPRGITPISAIGDAATLGDELFTQLALCLAGVLNQPALDAALDGFFDRRMRESLTRVPPETNPDGLVVVNVDSVGYFLFNQLVVTPAARGGEPAGPLDLFEYVIGRMSSWQATHPAVHLHQGGVNYWAGLRDLQRDDLFGGLLYMSQAVAEDERSGGKRVTPASLFISLDASNPNQAAYERVHRYSSIVDGYLAQYASAGLGSLSHAQLSRVLRRRQSAALAYFHFIAQLPVVADTSTLKARSHRFAGLAYSFPLLELCLVFEELVAPKLPSNLRTLGDMIQAYRPAGVVLDRTDVTTSNRAANANAGKSVESLLDRQKLIGRRKRITAHERDVLLLHAVRNRSAHRADRSLVFAMRFEDIARHLMFACFYAVEWLY